MYNIVHLSGDGFLPSSNIVKLCVLIENDLFRVCKRNEGLFRLSERSEY